MKQTAVEWLINKHFGGIDNVTPDFKYHIKQAIEMENQQEEGYVITKESWDAADKITHDGFIYVKFNDLNTI